MSSCRAELCPNWPGEGCVKGIMDCPEADDFYDDAEDPNDLPGPIFTAGFDSEDACCGNGIEAGQRIRADGSGGWIHALCQELAGAPACGRCFLVHKGECP